MALFACSIRPINVFQSCKTILLQVGLFAALLLLAPYTGLAQTVHQQQGQGATPNLVPKARAICSAVVATLQGTQGDPRTIFEPLTLRSIMQLSRGTGKIAVFQQLGSLSSMQIVNPRIADGTDLHFTCLSNHANGRMSLDLKLLQQSNRVRIVSQPKVQPRRTPQVRQTPAGRPGPVAKNRPNNSRPAATTGSKLLELREYKIIDRGWGQQPVVAHTFLGPVGWNLRGGVIWQNAGRCLTNMIRTSVELISPDGRNTLAIIPQFAFAWSNDPVGIRIVSDQARTKMGCPMRRPGNVSQMLLQYIVPQAIQNATLSASEPIPSWDAAQRRMQAIMARHVRTSMPSRYSVESALMTLAGSHNGQPVAMLVSGIKNVVIGQLPNQSQIFNGNVFRIFAARAPSGQLGNLKPYYMMMLNSFRTNPRWQFMVNQLKLSIRRGQLKNAWIVGQIKQRAQQEISAIQMRGWQNRQRLRSKGVPNFIDAIREVQNFRNPATGKVVQVPQNYPYVWSNGKGGLLVSQNPLNNPAQNPRFSGQNWTPLQAVR